MNSKNAIIGLILCSITCACQRHKGGENSDKNETSPVIDVAYPSVTDATLYHRLPGYLSANSEVPIVAQVSGRLLTSNYTAGSHVERGQILFTIEPTTYRDALLQAEATEMAAISAYQYAKANYQALVDALEADAVSRIEVAEAESSLQQSEAQLRSATAAVTTARTALSHCTITAPISGRISRHMVDPGSYVDGATSPVTLAHIYDDRVMAATFSISDRQYADIINNQGYSQGLTTDSLPIHFNPPLPHNYYASLDYTDPAIDTATGTLRMRALIPNTYNELRSGMYMTIDLPYVHLPNALTILDAAFIADQRGAFVYTVDRSNRIAYTPITIGPAQSDSTHIVLSGLTDSTMYVTKATLKVRNGETISPHITK
jgi:RND family efflux transporter MFP subunit